MSDVLIVIRREFRERVRSRSFVLGTVLFPLFIAAVIILPTLFAGNGAERRLVVVDEAPPGVADHLAAILSIEPESETENRYVVEIVPGPLADVRRVLHARLRQDEIEGYIVLPAAVLEEDEVLYRSSTIPGPGLTRDLRIAAATAVQAGRLRSQGLEIEDVAMMLRGVRIQSTRITATGEEGGEARSAFLAAYIVAILIYFIVAFYGMNVLRSVLEEKTNRIAEVLISSMRATHLMAGKILGVGSAALLQVLIWAAFVVLLVTQSERVAARFGISPEMLQALEIDPVTALLLLAFFACGFLLFAALFAALGAAVTSDQEAQSLQMVIMIPLFVPLLFLIPLTTEPLGGIATALALIPFTAPIAMPMRMAAAPIPLGQVLLSLALLAAAVAVVAWISGKIYRIGILSTGRKPTLRELGHWLRSA